MRGRRRRRRAGSPGVGRWSAWRATAAGAREIHALGAGAPHWQAGDDPDGCLRRVRRLPLGAGGLRLFSAHLTGSCRMGLGPRSSVANPYGELRPHVFAGYVNGRYARGTQLKRVVVLGGDFSQEIAELTPTLKLRRPVRARKRPSSHV